MADTAATRPGAQRVRNLRRAQQVFCYVLLIIGAAIFILPFLWMITTSLKGDNEIVKFPPEFVPHAFHWRNFSAAWTVLPFNTFLTNSVIITAAAVAGNLVSCVLPAYAFARLRARGARLMFGLLLATMMIPVEVTIVPTFVMFSKMHLLNTFWPLILPAWFGSAFFIFLLRQFFTTIPRELDEAARIDGAGHLRILWSILLPQIKPAIATVAVFSFINNWNNLLGPLIYLRDENKYTMALGLTLFQGEHVTQYNQLMAVSLITLAPIIIIFFAAQRMFVRGVTLTGMGGR